MEILRTGSHIASSGAPVELNESDLDGIAATYNPSVHEAPLVVGHPRDNSPAFGWVKGLRRAGDRLIARAQALPELVELIRKGIYKKRSASLVRERAGSPWRLNHVGLLGGMPPAVKGLADIALAEGGERHDIEDLLTLSEGEEGMALEEKLAEFVASMKELVAGITGSRQQAQKQEFSEAERQELVKAEAEKLLAQAKAEFAQKLEAARAEKAAVEKQMRSREIAQFCEGLKKEGRLLPAWEKLGLVEFMLSLDAAEQVEFSQGTEKLTQVDFMKKLLSELPKVVNFSEAAGKEKTGSETSAAEKLEALVSQKMKEQKDMTYAVAFAQVQSENPELAAQYLEEMH